MSEYQVSPITTVEEAMHTKTVAARVFGRGSVLLLPRTPHWGVYAHQGDDVVGGAFLEQVSPREGVFAWIFVDPKAQGHRLGSRLMDAGVKAMDEEGLTTQFSLVRADNTASWNMFAKHGYKRPSVLKSLFGYSLRGFAQRFQYSLAAGYSTWVKDDALKDASIHPRRWAILKSLLFSLFIGAAMSLFSLRGVGFFYIATATVSGITALRMLVAYPLARMSGPVRFDAPQGGTSLAVILALAFSAWFPTFGSFVPRQDIWSDRHFARYNGLQAFATWMTLVLAYVGIRFLLPEVFQSGLELVLDLVIVYHIVPFFPFDGMDGARVLRYNKVLYALGVVVSVLVMFLV